jgi:MscS family membrane protein
MLDDLRSYEVLRPLFEMTFGGVPLAAWVTLLAVALLAGLAALLSARALRAMVAVTVRAAGEAPDGVLAKITGPLRLVFAAWLFSAGAHALGLPESMEDAVDVGSMGLTVLGAAWLLARLVDVLGERVSSALVTRGNTAPLAVVPLGRRAVKALIAAVALTALLQNLGFDATSLLAGLGIGGLAVALAAQKTVENLFGGVTLITDQPVRVGDFCRFGDAVGTVEDVGLRSTGIRTLERTLLTVPNSQFASAPLENFAPRDRFLLKITLGLRYETTPDQLRHVLIGLKRLLVAHPRVHPDPARARFAGFGAYSLDVEIFAYLLTTDIDEFHAIREDILLRMMDVVAASGTGFAFPSQTLYAAADAGLDAGRAQAAVAEVVRWRTEGVLPLPELPADVLGSLRHTLPYPPEGSVARG